MEAVQRHRLGHRRVHQQNTLTLWWPRPCRLKPGKLRGQRCGCSRGTQTLYVWGFSGEGGTAHLFEHGAQGGLLLEGLRGVGDGHVARGAGHERGDRHAAPARAVHLHPALQLRHHPGA